MFYDLRSSYELFMAPKVRIREKFIAPGKSGFSCWNPRTLRSQSLLGKEAQNKEENTKEKKKEEEEKKEEVKGGDKFYWPVDGDY